MPVSSNPPPAPREDANSFHTSASNFLDSLFFLRVFVLISKVRKIDYIGDLHLYLGKPETARVASEKLAKAWKKEKIIKLKLGTQPSLYSALYRCFGVKYLFLALWKMAWAFFVWFCAYYLIKELLKYTDSQFNPSSVPQPQRNGIGYATAIFVCCVCSSISFHSLSSQCTRIGIQCRAALVTMIYRKALKLSYVGGIGDVINLICNDCNRVAEACVNWHFLWSAALESLIIVVLALVEAQGSALISVILILVVFLPIQHILARRASAISYLATASITKRVALMSEILTTIRLVKFYALESYFQEKIGRARKAEMRRMQKALRLKIFNFALIFIAPVLTTLATYVSFYVLHKRIMSPVELFTMVSLFNTLRYPLLMLPNAVRTIAGAQISLQRLEDYFMQHDVDALPKPATDEPDAPYIVEIEGGCFTMEGPTNVELNDISLKLAKGQLIALVGDLDSCKAILFAIMGEVRRHSGTIVTRGVMSFVPQEPWLIQATFRDNILFGSAFDEARYDDVLDRCSLKKEIAALSDGDQTYINDLTLSEIQRCRIVLARALYWNPDFLIYEDPFSEYSSHVSREVFNSCVLPFVRQHGKTVLLHTQHRRFMNECDNVVYIKGDRIVCTGPYEAVKKQAGAVFNNLESDDESISSESSCFSSDSAASESASSGRGRSINTAHERRAASASPELEHAAADTADQSPGASYESARKKSGRRHSEQLLRDSQQRAIMQFSFSPQPLQVPESPSSAKKASSSSLKNSGGVTDEYAFPVSVLGQPQGAKASKKTLASSGELATSAKASNASHYRDFSTQSSPSHMQRTGNMSALSCVKSKRGAACESSSSLNGATAAHVPAVDSTSKSGSPIANSVHIAFDAADTLRSSKHAKSASVVANAQFTPIPTITEGVVLDSEAPRADAAAASVSHSQHLPAAQFFSNHQKTITSLYDGSNNYLASAGPGGNGLTVQSLTQVAFDTAADDSGVRSGANISLSQAYKKYIREGSGISRAVLIFISFVVVHAGRYIGDVWLSWSTRLPNPEFSISNAAYVGIYGGICGFVVVGVIGRGFVYSYLVISRSKGLHNRALKTILRAPLGYFDVTPLGQILSTFAKHLYLIDDFLPEALLQVLSFGPIIIGTLVLAAVYLPYYWATIPAYIVVVWLIITYATSAEARLKLLEASNKAPLFSHFSTTLEGVHYIRLCRAQDRFEIFFRATVDADHKALCALMLVRSFHGLYLDLVCSVAIYMACIFVVVFNVEPSIAGLTITNTMQLLLFLQWFVRMAQDAHVSLDGLRQLMIFTKSIPAESPDIIKDHRVEPDWPQTGALTIKDLTLRYHRYGAAALKKVSAVIKAGEKIGIVGANGSGKTSLIMALLRAVEYNGTISIDGQDIKEIGLRDLRRHIAVVPMDPVLLTGTIRSNLDPFHIKTDDEVWKVLQSVHLAHKIRDTVGKLDAPIVEHGRSFTLAERRLLSIARAILQSTKLVIIDEPTSSMDPETDSLIQKVILDKFVGCTVLMMATQLDSVMACQRLFVLDSGRLVETGTPLELLSDPESKACQFAKSFYHSASPAEFSLTIQSLLKLASLSSGAEAVDQHRHSAIVPPSLQELFQSPKAS